MKLLYSSSWHGLQAREPTYTGSLFISERPGDACMKKVSNRMARKDKECIIDNFNNGFIRIPFTLYSFRVTVFSLIR
jgi:hypothetical protein